MNKFLLAVSLIAATATMASAETPVEMKDVPLNIQAAFMNAAQQHGAKLDAAAIDTDGGKATYEFRTTDAAGVKREFDFHLDGSLDEIETIIDAAAIPANVMAMFGKFFSAGKMTKVEHSMRGNGAVWYETDMELNGAEFDADVSGDGSAILIAQDAVN
jgi:hypothetical protein